MHRGCVDAVLAAILLCGSGACRDTSDDAAGARAGFEAPASSEARPPGSAEPAVEEVLRAISDNALDFTAIARRSFREYWNDATVGERAELVALLSEILAMTYVANSQAYPETDRHVLELRQVETGWIARTEARRSGIPSSEFTRTDYSLHRVDGELRLFDQRIQRGGRWLGSLTELYYDAYGRRSVRTLSRVLELLRARRDEFVAETR